MTEIATFSAPSITEFSGDYQLFVFGFNIVSASDYADVSDYISEILSVIAVPTTVKAGFAFCRASVNPSYPQRIYVTSYEEDGTAATDFGGVGATVWCIAKGA